jgi:DNA-directed RNA polymerase specialized sigma subunit
VGTHAAEIRHAVHALAPFECTCINLRYAEEMTTTDIACRLQCSRRRVTVALDDSYKVLRQKLAYLSPSWNLP